MPGAGMAATIGQGFLDDPEECQLALGVQPPRMSLDRQLDVGTVFATALQQKLECRAKAELVERRWAQIGHDRAQGLNYLGNIGAERGQALAGDGRIAL